jgi:hypothetical protein
MASLKDTLRNARLDAITAAAGATASLIIYTGAAPSKTSAPSGTLLVSFSLPNPIAPASSGGTLTLSAISPATGAASGTPGYARLVSGTDDGTRTVEQLSAGIGTGEVNFSGTVSSGGQVSITSFVETEGNA